MAINHSKSFLMPLLLMTNLLILLSFIHTIPAEARHLLETSLPEEEVPDDQTELPNFPGLPSLEDILSNFHLPPLPFNIPNFSGLPSTEEKPEAVEKVPKVGKAIPSSAEAHSSPKPWFLLLLYTYAWRTNNGACFGNIMILYFFSLYTYITYEYLSWWYLYVYHYWSSMLCVVLVVAT